MSRTAWCVTFALICGLTTLPAAAQSVDRNEIIRQARQSYYSLKSEGLTEFRCQVQVGWNAAFKSSGVQLDELARNQLLPILEKTYYQVLVGSSGTPTVLLQSQVSPPNEEVAKRFKQTTSGMDAVITGATHIWSMFMISPPLPSTNSDYQLENKGDKYLLTYDVGANHFVISLTHDLVIDEARVSEPELEATLRPTFARLQDGLVLVGYEYQQNSKGQSGNSQQFSVKIEYREVQGLMLPSAVNLVEPLAAAKVEIPLMFTDCQAKKDANRVASDGADQARPKTAQPGASETNARTMGNLEVISDTLGVDFGPYLSRLLQAVRMNWYHLIPDEARPPLMRKGKVSIEFKIMPDGKISGMTLSGPSGDVALDRAAWSGITASTPFQPLPSEFHGPYLALRFHFYYNPARGDTD